MLGCEGAVTKRATFRSEDVTRAFKAAAKAGVHAAVVLRPDGAIEIVPTDAFVPQPANSDLDKRLDAFGSR